MARLALDSSVLIYLLDGEAPLHHAARDLLGAVEAGRHQAVWSTMAVAETLVHPLASGQSDYLSRARRLVLEFPNSEVLPVSAPIAEYGAGLRVRFPALRLPDALHLATAVAANADRFVTTDAKLLRLKVEGLAIQRLG